MTREEMLNDVIRKYGFEAPETIRFARVCEKPSEMDVEILYGALMAMNVDEDE